MTMWPRRIGWVRARRSRRHQDRRFGRTRRASARRPGGIAELQAVEGLVVGVEEAETFACFGEGGLPDLRGEIAAEADEELLDAAEVAEVRLRPKQFLGVVRARGAVAATKQLLADPRHTSYGFEKL
ncbi:hypothetical protein [Actinomadura alba]|uniref:Uncharacterized protein n=1 Tax=Actinomadura alba TaxID=406431 RepID=A0ABR7LVY4_9ACTN|nr:hypothetical protein [Actinomadura alba]MBC6468672.1 hypothetical protein [Actinomadura alba]